MRTHVVHWGDITPKLPFAGDSLTKIQRRDLFETCDPRGIGLLSQTELVRYFFRLIPLIGGVSDTREVLNLCFRTAREAITPVIHIGNQQLDRNQFRAFLMNIWYYIKLWELFCTLDEAGERVVNVDMFIKLATAMAGWGFGEADEWLNDPDPIFQRLDRSGCGEITFDELAEFGLRQGIPKLCAPDDEEERKLALDLLTRTDPNLATKVAPSFTNRGSVPPVPPPGQKLPPSLLTSPKSSPLDAELKKKHWSSQYMVDYMAPSRRSSRPGSTVASTAPTTVPSPSRSRALSRAGSKELPCLGKNQGEPARTLHKTRSAPSINSSINSADGGREGLDRNELRAKLEQNLGMYSTGQMRRILEVAGGMVVGGPQA